MKRCSPRKRLRGALVAWRPRKCLTCFSILNAALLIGQRASVPRACKLRANVQEKRGKPTRRSFGLGLISLRLKTQAMPEQLASLTQPASICALPPSPKRRLKALIWTYQARWRAASSRCSLAWRGSGQPLPACMCASPLKNIFIQLLH